MDFWHLYEYQNAFTDIYQACDDGLQRKIDARVAQLVERGNLVGEPVSKKLKGYDGLFELRANKGNRHVRFFYMFKPGRKIIFVHACFKDQRSMSNDYEKADGIRKSISAEPRLLNVITEIH